ncbi:hypothetical protein BH09PSE1_BH09PSE1_30430 [soil metagenome]
MGQLLIRNVDDADIAELKAQAERERISLEQRLRNLVVFAARRDRDTFWETARKSREATQAVDVDALLRDSRQDLLDRDPFSGR